MVEEIKVADADTKNVAVGGMEMNAMRCSAYEVSGASKVVSARIIMPRYF